MLIFSLFLPLILGSLGLIFLNSIGNKLMIKLTVISLFIFLVVNYLNLYFFSINNDIIFFFLYDWIYVNNLKIEINLLFDNLTILMFFIVYHITFLVYIYSIEYMENDPSKLRFLNYLLLFMFFMLFLVSSGNYLQLFIGWEGVGLISFLLISFWNTRYAANKAAVKAMVINRIGDICLLLFIVCVFYYFGSFNFGIIFNIISEFNNLFLVNFLVILLLLGAMSKSAQIGLHVWLPDAMEGPTPVSALLHAATMVTAGIFLLLRSSFLLEYSSFSLFIAIFFGSITCFFMGILGIFQFDIKKIVAYSTCSQLGYMFMSIGFSNYQVTFFHLFNHAFFKALLFLGMGSIIHALQDEQDFRRMGGLINFLPFTYSCVLIGNIALMGLPFLAGFYSKDLLLELVYIRVHFLSYFSYILGIFGAFFTSLYSIRLLYWIFFNKPLFSFTYLKNMHESNKNIFIVLSVLSILSIFVGYFFFDFFVGIGTSIWDFTFYTVYSINFSMNEVEFYLDIFLKLLPIFITIIGLYLFFVFNSGIEYSIIWFMNSSFFTKFYKLYFFDYFYNKIFFINFLKLDYFFLFKFFEKNLFEIYGYKFFFNLNKIIHIKANWFFFNQFFYVILVIIFLYFFILHFFFIISFFKFFLLLNYLFLLNFAK